VIVSIWVAVAFTFTVAKLIEPGLKVSVDAAWPLPVNGTVCGDPGPESVIVSMADRSPSAVGAKTTSSEQPVGRYDPAEGYVPTQLPSSVKSPAFGPLIAAPVMVIGAFPEFVRETGSAALLVTLTAENVTGFGLIVSPITAACPVPLSGMICGELLALSWIVTVAERTPAAVGVNVTVTEHE